MSTVFFPIPLTPDTVLERDVTQFCLILSRYARHDTSSAAKRFHWPSYKRAVERHALPEVSFTSFTTAHADGPAVSVHGLAEYVVDVLAGQIEQDVDVGWLVHVMEQTVFDFASARSARWASFLQPAGPCGPTSGWEIRMVIILAARTEEDPMKFPCIVATVRIEGAVRCDQDAWASLGADTFSDPTITVDVMHCRVSKASERFDVGMYHHLSFMSGRWRSLSLMVDS